MPRHPSPLPLALLCASAVALVPLGLWLDSWWTIAGGMLAAIGAAWLATELAPAEVDRSPGRSER